MQSYPEEQSVYRELKFYANKISSLIKLHEYARLWIYSSNKSLRKNHFRRKLLLKNEERKVEKWDFSATGETISTKA